MPHDANDQPNTRRNRRSPVVVMLCACTALGFGEAKRRIFIIGVFFGFFSMEFYRDGMQQKRGGNRSMHLVGNVTWSTIVGHICTPQIWSEVNRVWWRFFGDTQAVGKLKTKPKE